MNSYLLYNQDTREYLADLKIACRDSFVIESSSAEKSRRLYDEINTNNKICTTYALIDPNGSVLLSNLRIKKCEWKGNAINIDMFQLRRVGQ